MSWFGYSTTSSTRSGNPRFSQESREQKRVELEAERLRKAKQKAQRKAYFAAGVSAPPSPTSSRANTPPPSEESEVRPPPIEVILEEDRLSLPDIDFSVDFNIFNEEIIMDFDREDETDGAKALDNLRSIQQRYFPSTFIYNKF